MSRKHSLCYTATSLMGVTSAIALLILPASALSNFKSNNRTISQMETGRLYSQSGTGTQGDQNLNNTTGTQGDQNIDTTGTQGDQNLNNTTGTQGGQNIDTTGTQGGQNTGTTGTQQNNTDSNNTTGGGNSGRGVRALW